MSHLSDLDWPPEYGKIEWRSNSYDKSMAGVWNPLKQEVEWCSSDYDTAMAGVWNPLKQEVEWRSNHYDTAMAAVWHPIRQEVEWRSSNYYTAMAGVWNPIQEEIEWRSSNYYKSMAAVWNPKTEAIEWKSSCYDTAMAGVWNPIFYHPKRLAEEKALKEQLKQQELLKREDNGWELLVPQIDPEFRRQEMERPPINQTIKESHSIVHPKLESKNIFSKLWSKLLGESTS